MGPKFHRWARYTLPKAATKDLTAQSFLGPMIKSLIWMGEWWLFVRYQTDGRKLIELQLSCGSVMIDCFFECRRSVRVPVSTHCREVSRD